MKRLFFFAVVSLLVAVTGTPALAARPADPVCVTIQDGGLFDKTGQLITLGYDQWGYNYQAHMFNGWYGNYSRPTTPVTGGDLLMMKWNDAWLSNKNCEGGTTLDRHYGFPSYRGSGAWLTNHASGSYPSNTSFHWSVNTAPNIIHIPWAGTDYQYSVTFSQVGTVLTGTLTDGYYPTTGLLNGSINGNDITFSFAYPNGSVQGIRTYIGTVDSSGNVSGTWSETGPEQAVGTWSVSAFANTVADMCYWSDFIKIVAAPTAARLDNTVPGNYGEGIWFDANNVEIGPAIWGEFAVIQEVSSNPCGSDLGLFNIKSQLRSGLGNW